MDPSRDNAAWTTPRPPGLARAAGEMLADLAAPEVVLGELPTVQAGGAVPGVGPTRLGPYELLAPIGQGGMGTVYRALDSRLRREVALKVIRVGRGADEAERMERFRREATALARLGKHPHLLQVHEFGHEGETWYFSMDLVEGTTLRRWSAEAPRDARGVVSMLRKVALGLAHAHANGLVHRDVKPENVLVGPDGEPQVADFGLVRDLGASTDLTSEGQVMGTYAYMAPEQASGQVDRIGPWTDVHALGVMLYERLSGKLPYEGTSGSEFLVSILTKEPPPLRARNPSIPEDLEAVTTKCLEKEPSRRYLDAGALAEDLRRWLDGEPVSATRLTPAYWARKKIRRHAARLAAALAAVVLVVVAVAYGLREHRSGQERAEAAEEAKRASQAFISAERKAENDGHGWSDAEVIAKLRAARGHADRAIGLAPGDVGVLGQRAQILRRLGELEGAIGDYTRVLAERPDDGPSYGARAECLLALPVPVDARGRMEEIVRDVEAYRRSEPGDSIGVTSAARRWIERELVGHAELASVAPAALKRLADLGQGR
ncbi:MAG: protein kinase [Planctomycetota bacterium]